MPWGVSSHISEKKGCGNWSNRCREMKSMVKENDTRRCRFFRCFLGTSSRNVIIGSADSEFIELKGGNRKTGSVSHTCEV